MNYRQKMNSLSVILFISTVQILTLATPVRCGGSSELLRIRRGVQKTPVVAFTRLVLELTGERPTGIAQVPPDKLAISFRELRSKLEPQILMSEPASTVAAITIHNAANGSQVLVQFRTPDCVVSHSFLPPEKPNPGAYRLMVDILPPAKGKASEGGAKEPKAAASPPGKPSESPRSEAAPSKPKTPENSSKSPKAAGNAAEKPGETARIEPAPVPMQPAPSKYREIPEASLGEPLKEANRLLAEGKYEQAFSGYADLLKESGLSKEESSLALYGLADSSFFMHQHELEMFSKEVTSNYLIAINANPSLIQAGWAYYRLGLGYEASGDHEKAIKAFQKPLQDFPGHPVTPLCWLELGKSYQKAGSYPQAVRALRAALELPLDHPQRLMGYWLLGVALHGMGEYVSAMEAFERCQTEDPDYYLSQPLLLKYLGDCYFFQKKYAEARDLLLWYLNLQPEAANRALVLAKIAETFSAQDEPNFANKLFDHIQTYYPNSDGDIIAQIRRAELLKSKGKLSPEDDLSFFRELAQKSLSPQLTKLIHLKLASRESEYGNFDASLSVIDYNLQESMQKASNEDFLALRPKVITDWLKSAYQNHDYGTVIMLYEKDQNAFAGANTVDFKRMIADSYAGLKQYQKAFTLYEQILATKGPAREGELLVMMAETAFQAKDFARAEDLASQVQGAEVQQKKKLLQARIAFAQQQFGKVVECLGSLSESDIPATSNPSLTSIYGESLAQLGECEKATPWLQRTSEQMEKTDTHSDELLHCYMVQATCFSKSGKHDKAIALLEEATTIAGTEYLRDQLHYDISKRYLELGQTEKAIQKLTKLMSSNQTFWQTAAKQQLDYIQMERK